MLEMGLSRKTTRRVFGGLAVICLLGAITVSPAAAATITFAQVVDLGGNDWSYTTSGSGCNTPAAPCTTTVTITSTGVNALFVFLPASGVTLAPQEATFSLTATLDSTTIGNCATNCAPDTGYTQAGYSGSFEYLEVGGADPGADLLSGTFSGAIFATNIYNPSVPNDGNGQSGSLILSDLSLSSAFMNFAGSIQQNGSWAYSSITPPFTVGTVSGGDQAYPTAGTFTASAAATFATTVVPESTSTTLTSLGIALCGLAFLQRRARAKAPLAVR